MKRIIILLSLISMPLFFSSCYNVQPTITDGAIYSHFTTPLMCPDSDTSYTKKGEACTYSILGIVAFGNGGTKQAAVNGNIDKLKMVEMEIRNYCHFWISYNTIVYGN